MRVQSSMTSRKYSTPLTELTGESPQRFECTNSNGFITWEVDWRKESLWLLANWYETHKSQECTIGKEEALSTLFTIGKAR